MKNIIKIILLSAGVLAACNPGNPTNENTTSTVNALSRNSPTPRLINKQVLITIDESPFTPQTDLIARSLRAQGITAVFFLVGDKLSDNAANVVKPNGDVGPTYYGKLRAIIENGHYVANHSLTHPCDFGKRTANFQANEIIKAHRVIYKSLERLGNVTHENTGKTIDPKSRFLRWFRPPCGSWDANKANDIQANIQNWGGSQTFGPYKGPISWTIGKGIEDFTCVDPRKHPNGIKTAKQCSDAYMVHYKKYKKGVALFHGNIASPSNSEYVHDMINHFIKSVKQSGGSFANPTSVF